MGNAWEVKGLSEETGYSDQETLLLGFGRTFFPPGVVDFFSERFLNPATGEVDLLLTFEALIKEYKNYAELLEGKAMDFGTWAGYEHFFKGHKREISNSVQILCDSVVNHEKGADGHESE